MKEKTCRYCKGKFVPVRMKQIACSTECAESYAIKVRARAEQINALESRKTIRLKLDQLKTRSQWMKEAQRAFNAYIRLRDQLMGYPCISSGQPLDWSGNNVDAGHYRSTGSAPHLRFNEMNCHAQSKKDNRWLNGNAVDYRIGLIKRIGIEEVEKLEADQEAKKYTIEELKQIIATYKQKAKELRNAK